MNIQVLCEEIKQLAAELEYCDDYADPEPVQDDFGDELTNAIFEDR